MISTFLAVLSYAGSYRLTFEDFLQQAAELGFRAVQLTPDQEPNLYHELLAGRRCERLLDLKEQLGMTIYMHNVFYDINMLSLVPAVRETAFQVTEDVLRLSVSLGASTLTVHPGYMFPGWRGDTVQGERFWHSARSALERLGGLAEEYEIPVLVENGSYHVTTADGATSLPLHVGILPREVLRLVEMSGRRLRVSLDINKALRSRAAPEEFIETLGEFIEEFQASAPYRYPDVLRRIGERFAKRAKPYPLVLEGGPDDAARSRIFLASFEEETEEQ